MRTGYQPEHQLLSRPKVPHAVLEMLRKLNTGGNASMPLEYRLPGRGSVDGASPGAQVARELRSGPVTFPC